MVIQRWQSLLLFVAAALMCAFCITPFAQYITPGAELPVKVTATDAPVYLILNIVIALLLFIAIFMYKNLKLQMRITCIGMLLIVASAITGAFITYYTISGASVIWYGGVLELICALLFAQCALRCMKSDEKLLKSYDRLR